MATAGPSGTAIVGGMGIAVSIPTSTAVGKHKKHSSLIL